jgi:hypothetical protein
MARAPKTAKPVAPNAPIDADAVIVEALKLTEKAGKATASLALLVIRDDANTYSTIETTLNQTGTNSTKAIDGMLCRFSPHYQEKLDRFKEIPELIRQADAKKDAVKSLNLKYERDDIFASLRSVRVLMSTALKIARVFRGHTKYVSADIDAKTNRILFKEADGTVATDSANGWAKTPATPRLEAEAEAKKAADKAAKESGGTTAQTAKAPPAVQEVFTTAMNTLDMLKSAKTADGKPAPIGKEVANILDKLFAKLAVFYGKEGKPDWKAAERKVTAVLYTEQHPNLSAQKGARDAQTASAKHPEAAKA